MKYLSGLDNLFFNQETPTQYMHVGGLGVYDPSTATGGKVRFKSILDFFVQRMSAAPVFRRRLVENALPLERPYWIADSAIDVEYHVRHLALPEPGDWRQLMIQIARIHARPMDLSRPPWEAYIIGGLDNIAGLPEDSFALYLKLHHCAIDGESAAHLIGSLHTWDAEFDQHSRQTAVADREPGLFELVSRGIANKSEQAAGLASLGLSLGKYGLKSSSEKMLSMLTNRDEFLSEQYSRFWSSKTKRPTTRFNAPLSPHRALDAVGFSMDDCAAIRANIANSTINDIFLTVVGGAMTQYLTSKGEKPAGSLMGSMPMTTRGEDKSGDEGNQIAQVYYSLRTDIDDPVARLQAVHQETDELKSGLDSGLGKDFQQRLLDVLPASLIAKPLTAAMANSANVNVSNVRGPSKPLYMAGARLERFIPFSLITEGCGLNITGFSYNGILWVAVTGCRDMLPDPAFFSECLQDAFEQLKAAAQKCAGKSKQRAAPTRRKRSQATG